MLVIEDILGRCAPLLGIDPAELRRRNFYPSRPDHPLRPAGSAPRAGRRDLAAGARRRRRRAAAATRSREFNARAPSTSSARWRMTPVKFGISFNLTAFNQAGALVHVYKDGSVLINHGGTEMGQGLHTKMLQVAATTLGIPLRRVRLAPDAHGQGAQHVRDGRELRGRPQRRRGQERLRADPRPARAGRGGQLGANPSDVRIVDGVAQGLGSATGGALGGARPRRLLPARPALRRRLLPHRGAALGLLGHARVARSSTSRTARPRPRSRSTASPGRTARGGSTSSTTSATASPRWSTSARSRAASCRAPAGSPSRICAGTTGDGPAAVG